MIVAFENRLSLKKIIQSMNFALVYSFKKSIENIKKWENTTNNIG